MIHKLTPEEKKDLAINHAKMALDQLSITMNIAMNIVMAFAKACPKKQIEPKYTDTIGIKRIIRYRKRFNQLNTINVQMRANVLSKIK